MNDRYLRKFHVTESDQIFNNRLIFYISVSFASDLKCPKNVDQMLIKNEIFPRKEKCSEKKRLALKNIQKSIRTKSKSENINIDAI